MANDIERIYTIPLRKEWLKEPRSKRTNRSVRTVREFVKRHTKAENIRISKGVNELLFSRGFKKPPAKIRIEVRGNREKVSVKLPGEVIIEKKKEAKKGVAAGLRERLAGKTEEEKKEILKSAIQKKVEDETTKEKVEKAVEKVQKAEKQEKTEKSPKKPEKKEEKK